MTTPGYNASATNARQYAEGWMNMMVTIWQEKIREYEVYDTGALMQSFQTDLSKWADESDKGSIVHKFLQYGIYAERGHGREISVGNSGDQGQSPKRIPKPWLSKKYLYSIFRLGEHFAANYGHQFCKIIKDTLEAKAG